MSTRPNLACKITQKKVVVMQDYEDLYKILQVHPSAEPDIIRAAHRHLALRYHPDRNHSPMAADMMTKVNNAYEILSDPKRRAAYDQRQVGIVLLSPGQAGALPREADSSLKQLLLRRRVLLIALLLVVVISGSIGAALALGSQGGSTAPLSPGLLPSANDPIIFSDLNWDSAQLQNRIAMYIVEHGFGYPVDTIIGDSIALFDTLVKGQSHVTMEIWLPNSREAFDVAVSEGSIISVGSSLDDNWQSAFVVPSYLIEEHPGLRSVSDLPEYKELFATSATAGKARLVSCITGWRCQKINESKIKAYGLEDVVEAVNPGSAANLFASLEEAYENRAPWLGYMWGPTKTALELDLTVLTEPPYSNECWETDKACAYPTSRIMIAVHPDLMIRAPEVVDFLQRWDFRAESQVAVESWIEENEASLEEGALWFLKNQQSVWREWTTDDVAQRVVSALES